LWFYSKKSMPELAVLFFFSVHMYSPTKEISIWFFLELVHHGAGC